MFEPDPSTVEELEFLMRDLSEIWYANWMGGVEFALWDAVQGNPDWHGVVQIPDDEIAVAKRLSGEIRGWVSWPDEWARPGYIPLDEWLNTYTAKKAAPKPEPPEV